MVNTVTITGCPNEWSTLIHLQTWVTKNAKSYFETGIYLKAEGCVRDELVALGSVSLGNIEGTVSDGTGSACAVTLTQHAASLIATCDCVHVKPEQLLVKQEGGAPTSCHHLAAFLMWVADANNEDQLGTFVCGNANTFNYKGYLAAYKTREELIELLDLRTSKKDKRAAMLERAEASTSDEDTPPAELISLFKTVFDLIDETSGSGEPGEEGSYLGPEIREVLHRDLVPFFTSHPEAVQRMLRDLIKYLHKADLEVQYDNHQDWQDDDREFSTDEVCEIYIQFILSQPEDKQPEILREFIKVDTLYMREHCPNVDFSFIGMLGDQPSGTVNPTLADFLDKVNIENISVYDVSDDASNNSDESSGSSHESDCSDDSEGDYEEDSDSS